MEQPAPKGYSCVLHLGAATGVASRAGPTGAKVQQELRRLQGDTGANGAKGITGGHGTTGSPRGQRVAKSQQELREIQVTRGYRSHPEPKKAILGDTGAQEPKGQLCPRVPTGAKLDYNNKWTIR